MLSKEKHFFEIELILKKFEDSKFEIIISLHPRSNYQDYKYLEKKGKIKIIKKFNLLELIPNSRYFICTFSSTYIWAEEFGVPVIMLDYLFKYAKKDDIKENQKLLIIDSKNKFSNFSITKYESSLENKKIDFNFKSQIREIEENYINFIKSFN